MKHFLLYLSIFFLHLGQAVHATIDVRSTFFTINEGLADNLVRHIYQDSKGFMWMSTLNGLSRYDGYSFVTFRPEKGEHPSLADRHVLDVSEDKNGFLWIKTSPGLYSCYDLQHNRFVDFSGCGEYKEQYSGLLKAENGDIWLWHNQNGCRKVTFKDGSFSSIVFKEENGKLPTNKITQLLEDNTGNIWICTEKGVIKISEEQSKVLAANLNVISAFINDDNLILLTAQGGIYQQSLKDENMQHVTSLVSSNETFRLNSNFRFNDRWIIFTPAKTYVLGLPDLKTLTDPSFSIPDARHQWDNVRNLWLYNQYGQLRYLNPKDGKIKDFDFMKSDEHIPVKWFNVIQDKRGLFWFATYDKGLYIYNPDTDELKNYTYRPEMHNRINSNNLVYILEDRTGSIWVSSETSGISHLSIVDDGASRIYPNSSQLINQASSIRMLEYMNNGEIWMGNRKNQLYKYDAGLTKLIHSEKYNSTPVRVVRDVSGKLWIATSNDGLNIDGHWYVNDPNNPESLAYNKLSYLFCDYKRRMWVATFGGGLDLAVPSNDGSYTFRHFLQGNLSQQEIRIIRSDKNNWMWVGTDDGVCVFHPDSIIQNPSHFYRYTYENNYLPGNEVKAIHYDSQGRIWLGTMGGGISVCTPKDDYANLHFTHYTTADGLINNMLLSIIEDQEKKIWITTGYGISRLDPETMQFENFLFDTSTLGNVYNENSALLLPDGRLLFGTDHGLLIIDPTKIKSGHQIPNVVLTDLKINGISVNPGDKDSPLIRSLSYTETIQLKYVQNSFVVEFSTLDYQTLNGTKYSYKLDGFDKGWSTASSLNFAAYKNLPPGNYTLHLKACNAVGTWSDKETLLQITITPPVWKTIWAYLIYILLLTIIVFIAFRTIQRINSLRNRIQVENQLTEYKLVFFTNISHEFRTPLTLIQGALEKIENIEKLPKDIAYPIRIMERNTQRLLRLVNQLLEFRKMQNKKLSLVLEETDIIAFLREIHNSFSETAEKKKMHFKFVSSVDSYRMFVDRGMLDKMIYNLLSNAFKYTPNGGKIIFSTIVDLNSGHLVMAVADSGVGIPKEKQSQLFSRFMQSNFSSDSMGIGLHLTHELVNIHKGSIKYHENEGGGSVFIISLPIDASVYTEADFLHESSLDRNTFLANEAVLTSSVSEEIKAIPLNKKKILIIEDDVDVSDFLVKELGIYFEVVSEQDGISGLERARSYEADLIVCDVLMPGMTGYEVTRKLKNDFDTSHIPIILLTAMSTTENQLEGIESGADAYITKPFSPRLLISQISQLIKQREKLREKFSNTPGIVQPVISSSKDSKFLAKLHAILEKQMSNPTFSTEDFVVQMNMARNTFFRKVRGITGYSPNEYIRILKMKKAAELLLDGEYNVSEISYAVGYNDPHYFSKSFKEHFGVTPSAYAKSNWSEVSEESSENRGIRE